MSPVSVGAAYSPSDLQADPVLSSPRVTAVGRYAIEQTLRPYVYGQSDPRLRPAV